MSDGALPDPDDLRPRRKYGGRQPLGELIRAVLKESGVGKDPTLRKVLRAWHEAVGAEMAVHTRVQGVKKGVVTIEVDSAPLLHELAGYMKHDLLRVLRSKADAPVTELKFRLGGGERDVRARR
jgi:predicted nucleic acid-binding Zn ribbon protein